MPASHLLSAGDRLGILRDDSAPGSDSQLAIQVGEGTSAGHSTQTLASRLSQQRTCQLLRVQGITLAYTIASAWLQLYATSWWLAFTGSEAIHLVDSPFARGIPQSRAYVDASFQISKSEQPRDSDFRSLASMLLELCFGHSFEEHPKWQSESAIMSVLPTDIARKAVADEWLKDVQWHVGLDYAQAVNWCLNMATLRNPEWRVEFARNVLQPLQRCYDECFKASQPRE